MSSGSFLEDSGRFRLEVAAFQIMKNSDVIWRQSNKSIIVVAASSTFNLLERKYRLRNYHIFWNSEWSVKYKFVFNYFCLLRYGWKLNLNVQGGGGGLHESVPSGTRMFFRVWHCRFLCFGWSSNWLNNSWLTTQQPLQTLPKLSKLKSVNKRVDWGV